MSCSGPDITGPGWASHVYVLKLLLLTFSLVSKQIAWPLAASVEFSFAQVLLSDVFFGPASGIVVCVPFAKRPGDNEREKELRVRCPPAQDIPAPS